MYDSIKNNPFKSDINGVKNVLKGIINVKFSVKTISHISFFTYSKRSGRFSVVIFTACSYLHSSILAKFPLKSIFGTSNPL